MRPGLRAQQTRRMIFFAEYAGKGVFGDILLRNLVGPANVKEDHIWIKASHWHGRLPALEDHVVFEANVEPYFRADGSKDWSLFRCEEVLL